MLFTKRIPNLALKGSSEEMGFEPRFKTDRSIRASNVPTILKTKSSQY